MIYRSTAQLIDQVPLAPKAPSNQYTGRFVIRRVGPIQLTAGDEVTVLASEQFDNENRNAGGVWKEWMLRSAQLHREGTVKRSRTKAITAVPWYWLEVKGENVPIDPHWSLWVGYNVGVWRTSSASADVGAVAVRERGGNWDNWRHHEPWHGGDAELITTDQQAWYTTTVWFDTNPSYRLPGQSIEITDRGSLTVVVNQK